MVMTLVLVLVGVMILCLVVVVLWWMLVSRRSLSRSTSTLITSPVDLLQPATTTKPTNTVLDSAFVALDQLSPDAGDVLMDALVHQARGQEDLNHEELNHTLWTAATTYRYGLGPTDSGRSLPAARAIYVHLLQSPHTDPVMWADAHTELAILDQEADNRRRYLEFMGRFEARQGAQPLAGARVPQILAVLGNYDGDARPETRPVRPVARSDGQNVHDTGLVASMRASLAKLKELNGPRPYVAHDLDEIRNSLPRQSAAQNVLDQMASNAVPLSAYGMTESEILSTIWGRIQDPINQDRREDLVKSLQSSLEQCYEVGGPQGQPSMVCATGRTTRAVQSLEKVDRADLVTLRPKWAMDQEIQTAGAHVYQKVLSSCTPDQQHACTLLDEDATPQQLQQQAAVKDRYSNALREHLVGTYKDVLSDTQIDARVESMVSLL
jgi:hypothetical protein